MNLKVEHHRNALLRSETLQAVHIFFESSGKSDRGWTRFVPGVARYSSLKDLACDHCCLQCYWVLGDMCNPPGVEKFFDSPRSRTTWEAVLAKVVFPMATAPRRVSVAALTVSVPISRFVVLCRPEMIVVVLSVLRVKLFVRSTPIM